MTDSSYPSPAVGIICFKNDEVLLIERGTPPLQGSYSLPGGRIEAGETTVEAAIREFREETGLSVSELSLIDVIDAIFTSRTSGEVTRHYLLFDYLAKYEGGTPVAGDDAAHAEWVPMANIGKLAMWTETIRVIEMAYTTHLRRNN